MKKSMFTSLALILTTTLCGCSTIYFHHHSIQQETPYGEWHHDGIFGLVEFSDPVDLQDRCGGNPWKVIKTEQPLEQGILSALTGQLYNPWNVSYSCEMAVNAPVTSSAAPTEDKTVRKAPRAVVKPPMRRNNPPHRENQTNP